MKEELREVIAKAVSNPRSYLDLTLVYDKGHELSGTTHFEMRAGGDFSLRSVNPRTQRTISIEGKLEDDQRDALLAAIDQSGLIDVPSSTRNIGDDEPPISVTLSYDNLVQRLLIWDGDARTNPEFQRFESVLRSLLGQLSGGP